MPTATNFRSAEKDTYGERERERAKKLDEDCQVTLDRVLNLHVIRKPNNY
jgi:hypothetical protein